VVNTAKQTGAMVALENLLKKYLENILEESTTKAKTQDKLGGIPNPPQNYYREMRGNSIPYILVNPKGIILQFVYFIALS